MEPAIKEAEKGNCHLFFCDAAHFVLAPYSPNLNIIERLWKFAKKKILYGRYYETPHLFHGAIRKFFDADCTPETFKIVLK